MIGYDNFLYVSSVEMIEEAEMLRESTGMPGYPREGYIVDNGNMLIVNLSEANESSSEKRLVDADHSPWRCNEHPANH